MNKSFAFSTSDVILKKQKQNKEIMKIYKAPNDMLPLHSENLHKD